MNSKEYEREMKKVRELQYKLNSRPFRSVGRLRKISIKLVIAIIVLAIIASVIQYVATGNATLLGFLKDF